MSKEQFPRVTFDAGTTPPTLILERATLADDPFHWTLRGIDGQTLEGAMGSSAPTHGKLSPVAVVRVCAALWEHTQGEASDPEDQEQRDNAHNLRCYLLDAFNIEEI